MSRAPSGGSGPSQIRCATWAIRTSASMSSSSSTAMSSEPSPTVTPLATSRRTGAIPHARRRLDEQLCATIARRSAMRSMSASRR